jgi:hypothetical protein
LPQLLEQIAIVREFRENPFHLCDEIVFIRERNFIPYLGTDYISRAAEVSHHRDGTRCKGFKDYARTEVANRRKDHHIRGSQPAKYLVMFYPTTEGNSLLDPKRFHKLLEPAPFWAVTNYGEAGRITLQKGSGRAQPEIASFTGYEPTNKDQLELGAGRRSTRVVVT